MRVASIFCRRSIHRHFDQVAVLSLEVVRSCRGLSFILSCLLRRNFGFSWLSFHLYVFFVKLTQRKSLSDL
jgi:hypothetical protein